MSKVISQPNPQSAVVPSASTAMDFDFDLWAVQVKRQMIASLRRRGAV